MKDIIFIEGIASQPTKFLIPGAFVEVKLNPLAGPMTAKAFVAQVQKASKVRQKPEDENDDPPMPQDAKFELSILAPGSSKPVAKETFQSLDLLTDSYRALPFTAPADKEGQQWRFLVKNVGKTDIRVQASVAYIQNRHRLVQTSLPLRVLNNAASQALSALEMRVHLDGDGSFIDFSEELKELSGGKLKRYPFDVSDKVRDINLRELTVKARVSGTVPGIRIFVDFETEGTEIVIRFAPDIDITKASCQIDLKLFTGFTFSRERIIGNSATCTVDFAASLIPRDQIKPLELIPDEEEVESALAAAIVSVLGKMEIREAISKYLTEGLTQLAQRGNKFYSISANSKNFLIDHYNPSRTYTPAPISDPPVVDSGPPISIPSEPVNRAKVEHIVVLMQENRSFDHMLGYLRVKKGRNDVDGLTGDEYNTAPGQGIPSQIKVNQIGKADLPYSPHHEHAHVLKQMADGAMSGFLESFVGRFPGANPRYAMSYYADKQVPTLDFFAKNFLICDRWFCSHPGPTQPNRFSLMCGKIPELENFDLDDPRMGFLDWMTIFDFLSEANVSWSYFEHDVAFLRFFARHRLNNKNIVPIYDKTDGFFVRAANGTLPSVTFIDPNFVDVPPIRTANDDHAPANIKNGQALMAAVYNALVSSPQWERTLFVVTYDEHGGFFDHVSPPGTAASPTTKPIPKLHPNGPTFLGPRVPATVISPWVPAGQVSHTVFEHTSITNTIFLWFLRKLKVNLGARVKQSRHLGELLTNDKPRLNVPRLGPAFLPDGGNPFGVPSDFGSVTKPGRERWDHHEQVRRFGRPRSDTF